MRHGSVSRAELVSWLRNELTEQKRVDLATSGVAQAADAATTMSARDLPASSDVHLLLPGDMKKQRRQTKQMFLDRAYDSAARIKAAAQSGMQVLAVDVPPAVFESLVKSSSWITDDDAWRAIATAFPVGQSAYAQQVRELAARRRADGHAFLLLFAVREERIGLLAL
jgi:translation initiation factor 2-alpha kinase 4